MSRMPGRRPPMPTVVKCSDSEPPPSATEQVIRTLAVRSISSANVTSGTVQWLESLLKAFAPTSERLLLRIPFDADAPVAFVVSTAVAGPHADNRRRAEVAGALDASLAIAFPTVRVAVGVDDSSADHRAREVELRPAGQIVDETSFKALGLRVVANESARGIHVASDQSTRPDLMALGHLLSCAELAGVTVTLEIERFERDVALKRILAATYQPLAEQVSRHSAHELAGKDGFGHALMAHLAWLNAGPCQRVTAWVDAAEPVLPILLDMICQAIYGVPCADGPPSEHIDLTRAWPDCSLQWLGRLPGLLDAKRRQSQRAAMRAAAVSGLRLGRQTDGSALHLAEKARAQHMFILGQTGTGKTTEIANMVAQDMAAGEAVIVFDAHGDLANDCRRLVPRAREKDLVYLHPTDPDGRFTLNVFEPLSGRIDVEHNRIANDLVNLFKRVYPEPKEAYGPMFLLYLRNAVFLLLSQPEPKYTVLDIQRVFSDDGFRRSIVRSCTREDVRTFWGGIAEDVGDYGENASIDNVAPYIIAKLTQLSGNEVLAPIIGAKASSIDFRAVAERKQICIVNLALPELGEEDAKILGGLLFARLSAALQAQVKLAPKSRLHLRVYLDEFQTYADETLAQSMAQMRKFGLSYTLACQNFAQVDGGGWRPDVGRAILGNAANLVLFRLGFFDANMLAAYLAPSVTPDELMRLPNFSAAARLLNDKGQPLDPMVFETDPPRD